MVTTTPVISDGTIVARFDGGKRCVVLVGQPRLD
jgi:hypothetical protein